MSKRLMLLTKIFVAAAVLAVVSSPGRSVFLQPQVKWQDGLLVQAAFGDFEMEKMQEVQARLDWFYGQRTAPGNSIPALARLSALQHARRMPVVTGLGAPTTRTATGPAAMATTGAAWVNIGPQPIEQDPAYNHSSNGGTYEAGFGKMSGRITALAVHPRFPDVVYAGAADGGVWKSSDAGTTWSPVGEETFSTLSIGAIAIKRGRTGTTIFVGTGEANTNGDSYWGSGIYRSTDGGATWTNLGGNTFDRHTVFRMLASSRRASNHIFAATNRGLYRSVDNGDSWSRVLSPGGPNDRAGSFITDLVPVPGTRHRHLVAAVGWRAGNANNGLWESTDAGATWTNVTSMAAGFAPQPNIGRTSLATVPGQPNLMYAVVQDAQLMAVAGSPTVLNGVYKTTSGVRGPWSLVANSQKFASDPDSALQPQKIGPTYQPGIQAWYNQYVTIDPVDPNHAVVGLEEIYDTDDGGATWHTIGRYWNLCTVKSNPPVPGCYQDPVTHPTTHPDQHAAVFTVKDGQPVLYAGSDGGVWRQSGAPAGFNNDSWVNLNQTLSTAQFYNAEASAGPNPVIYGGTQDNGSLKLENGRWLQVFGGDGGDVAVNPANANQTYEEYVYLKIAKSGNGGVSWTQINTPDSNDSARARFIAPFDMDPLDANHLVALGRNVWESNSGINTTASTWNNRCDSTDVTACDQGAGRVGTALGVRGGAIYTGWCGPCNPTDPLDPNAVGFASGMFSSVGGWHALAAAGLPNRYITSATIDPADDLHVYVTLSGFSRKWVPYAGTGHVFESTDGGATFTDISGNLPDGPANDTILFGGRLIVGTDVGVFELTDSATDGWSALGAGMPAVATMDLAMVPGTSTLMATTHGRGIYTLDLAA